MSTSTASQILSIIECPICSHLMRMPIYQCNKGHSICSNCKDSTRKCPSCEDNIGFIRNYALESIVTPLFDHPCPWANYGCQVKLAAKEIEKHKEICKHRIYQCPFCSTCPIWQGTNVELQAHLVGNHGEFQLLKDEGRIRNFFNLPYCHSAQFRFLIVKDNLFYFYQFESGEGTMNQYGVECVGSKENAKNFAYKIRISSEESTSFRKIHFSELCGSNYLMPFKVPRSLLDSYTKPTISLEMIEVNRQGNLSLLVQRGTTCRRPFPNFRHRRTCPRHFSQY